MEENMKDRINKIFESLEENPPSDRIKQAFAENQHRAAGKILDRARYVPNPPLTPNMKELARNFSNSCVDNVWEAEVYPLSEVDIFRWVTIKEITIVHLRELVHFYAQNESFKERIVELHTGAHCTEQGVIGTTEPKFSLADAQLVIDAGIKGGVYQVNNSSDPPTYSYTVDYVDAMCYSNRYKARIPTV